MRWAALFLITLVTVTLIDMIWLGYIAKQLYTENIGLLLRQSAGVKTPIIWSAVVVYLIMSVGIVFFVLQGSHGEYGLALIKGALLGMVIYGAYNFTNYSILANWPITITFIDFVWGTVLCGLSSVVVTMLQNRWFS